MEGRGYRKPTAAEVTERLKTLRRYRWSSYRAYAGYEEAPEWLETAELLARADRIASRRQIKYRQVVRDRLSCGVDPAHLEGLCDAVALGSMAFGRRIRALSGEVLGIGIAGRRALRRRVTLEEVEQALRKLSEGEWTPQMMRRGDWAGPMYLWAGRRWCGCTLRELGAAVGGMNYAAVSIALKRFEQRCAGEEKIRNLQASLSEMLNVEP